MSGAEPNWNGIYLEGKHYEGVEPPLRLFNYVSPGYFHTAGTRIVAGRDFTWAEIHGLRPVGMVSESLAHELWGLRARQSASASVSIPACRGMR
jgi:putative ABC transport system permease protein